MKYLKIILYLGWIIEQITITQPVNEKKYIRVYCLLHVRYHIILDSVTERKKKINKFIILIQQHVKTSDWFWKKNV